MTVDNCSRGVRFRLKFGHVWEKIGIIYEKAKCTDKWGFVGDLGQFRDKLYELCEL